MSDVWRPSGLRPAALFGIAAAHALVAWAFVPPLATNSPEQAVEVTIVPLGDAPEDRQESAQAAPEPVPAPSPTPTVAEAAPEPAPTPSPAPIVAEAPQPVAQVEAKPPPKPVAKAIAKPTRRAANAAAPSAAAKRGAETGSARASAASRAEYADLVAAEVIRHKVYPPSARERDAEGAVGVRFIIGPSGRVVSHTLIRPSGDVDLDAEVHTMMAEVAAPPPPDGRFSADLTIHFDLR